MCSIYNIVVGTYEGICYGMEVFSDSKNQYHFNIIFSNKNHESCIKSVTFCGNTYLASSSTDDKICVYNIKTKTEIGNLCESKEYIKLVDMNESLLGAIDQNGCFDIWDTNQWILVYTLTTNIYKNSIATLSPHPTFKGLILVVDCNSNIGLLDLYTKKYVIQTTFNSKISLIDWFPSSYGYYIVENRSTISFFEYKSDNTSSHDMNNVFNYSYKLDSPIMCVSAMSDEYNYIGTSNGNITLISYSNGVIYSWKAHDTRVKQLKILHDIHLLVSIDSKGVLKFWNILLFKTKQPDLQAEFNINYRPTCMDYYRIV